MDRLVWFVYMLLVILFGNVCGDEEIRTRRSLDDSMSDCKPMVAEPDCTGRTSRSSYRTLDGTCNNLHYTRWGAAFTPLARLKEQANYHDRKKLYLPLGFPTLSRPVVPTTQEVSNALFKVLHRDSGNFGRVSNLHMTFGQFMDHDIDLSPNAGGCKNPRCSPGSLEDFQYPCFPIKHSSRRDKGCMKFTRSFAICNDNPNEQREIVNVLSSFIDGSHIYGITEDLADRLRTNDDTGCLRVTSDDLLPMNPDSTDMCQDREGCFLAGDGRVNEHVGLVGFHTIFVREHNRIATELKKINTHWDGEKIYQVTRKIIGAILQHITYREYVPTLTYMRRYRGYNRNKNPSILNEFSTTAFRFGHSQITNHWSQLDRDFNKIADDLPLQETFFDNRHIFRNNIEPTFFGLVGNESERVDLKFADGVGKKLFIEPRHPGIANLIAINLQRGRDHGQAGYNAYRRICELPKAEEFEDFRRQIPRRAIKTLEKLYKDVDNHIDLFAAGLAERPMYGRLVGPTFACILRKQFERLRDGDRFWYERRGVFTRRQLKQIRKISMAKILCNNLRGIVSLQKNVFKVWHPYMRRHECSSIKGINLRAWKD